MGKITNPKGYNKSLPDPRQALFLSYYLDPTSATFSNALQSALRAGYSQKYAEVLTGQMPDWLSENLSDNKRLSKAEKILDKTLELEAVNEEGKVDNQLLKTQTDVAKFVANTIGKSKYSTKGDDAAEKVAQAITGMKIIKDGDSIQN